MALAEYLNELVDVRKPLRLSRLTALSGLTPEEQELLSRRWPEIEVRRRRRLVQDLGELAEDNVELNFDAVFLVALRDPDPQVRVEAIQGLWEYEGRDLIEPLVHLLHEDNDAGVRSAAAMALGRFALAAEFDALRPRDAALVDRALRSVIENPRETVEVRARAVEAIGARSEPWAREILERAYRSPERRLRVSSLHAMGRSCDEHWLPTLIRELGNEDPEFRYEAATACGALEDEGAVPYLAPLIRDEDEEVRSAAIDALGKIGGAQARRVLREHADDEDETVREAVAAALAQAEFQDDPMGFRYEL
ncbi:MAG TPA: HEAT repeat domain-containing protein [Dehalococcoidia bacterium]